MSAGVHEQRHAPCSQVSLQRKSFLSLAMTNLHGLYAITGSFHRDCAQLLAQVEQAITGGARLLQYRNKQAAKAQQLSEARALQQLCSSHGIPLIINDDIELAAEVGADGVHLGKEDGSVSSARRLLGAKSLIGVSCYDSLQRAIAAAEEGASYVAFGRFFPSASKPLAAPASINTLRQARHRLELPIVAIGGVTVDNGAQLLHAGADMLAVIDAVFGQDDIEQASRRLASLFSGDNK